MKKITEDSGRKIIPTKIIETINKHKKAFALSIIITYIVILLIPFLALGGIGHGALEKSYFISQILAALFVIIAGLIALAQYIANNNEIDDSRKRQKIVEAAELANLYRKEVLPLSGKLSKIYSNNQYLKEITKVLQEQDLILFNKKECTSIFGKDKLVEWITECALSSLMLKELQIDNNKETLIKMLNNETQEVANIVSELANTLEYFSIKLNTNIADKKTVYQSLHGDFFECVRELYIYIASLNIDESDRLYSNIMKLYVDWNNEFKRIKAKEEEIDRKNAAEQKSNAQKKELEKHQTLNVNNIITK